MLRDRLIFLFQEAESDRWTPVFVVNNVEEMYKAYHELGGNGLITQLYADYQNLPHVKPKGDDNIARENNHER